MEHLPVQGSAQVLNAFSASPIASPTKPSEREFASAIEAATSPSAETTRAAEELIGTQIRPPAGGCGCDALAATVTASPEPVRLDASRAVQSGDLLELAEDDRLGRPHLAVARSTLEMISVGGDGVVRVEPIPFDRLLGLLRQ